MFIVFGVGVGVFGSLDCLLVFLIGFISALVINFPTINCQVLMHKSVRNYKLVENKNGIEGVMVMKADQRTREIS